MSDERPIFFESIDSSFTRFYEEFYRYCHSRLLNPPVPFLRGLDYDESLDVVHAVVVHCVGQDSKCGVLKKYDSAKGSFGAWLYIVALNKYRQHLRRMNREVRIDGLLSADEIDTRLASQQIVDYEDSKLNDIDLARYLQDVQRAIEELGKRCQILFQFLQDGYQPKDVEEFSLRIGKLYDNKWIGTQISRCRERLKRKLEDWGLPTTVDL